MLLNRKLLPLSLGLVLAMAQPALAQQSEPSGDLVSGMISAIAYPVGSGFTKVNMGATSATSQASGTAWVDPKQGATSITLRVSKMPPATQLGAEFLTYVLWTVTPDGTTTNLGEVTVDQNGNGKLEVKAQSQTFALIVTAEPYYAVSLPSQVIVLENKNTTGQVYADNSYKLMKRSEYQLSGNPMALTPDLKKAPLELYEARNAVDIAKARGAQQYAPQVLSQALSSLQLAENAASGHNKDNIISAARQSIQFAEDARAITARAQLAQRIQQEKDAAAALAAQKAREAAEAQAALDAKRQAELTAAKEAEMTAEAKAQAAQAAAQAAQQKAAAEIAAAQAAAVQAALQQKEQAATAAAAQAKAATAALRAQVLQQLNEVLQTSETARGLVVHMADVLFNLGKYDLSMDAQLKLAKLSGIIQAHPGLNLAIEGYTDNSGTPAINMKLSQQRADATRRALISDGLAPGTITAAGMGQASPIADNSTAIGRQLNRRVEIIVSGKVIGINISPATAGATGATPATTVPATTTPVTTVPTAGGAMPAPAPAPAN